MKLCVGASSGGHMNELLLLLDHSNTWPVQPEVFVATLGVSTKQLSDRGRVYIIGEANRKAPLRAVAVVFRAFVAAIKERPDVVVTTGSMPLALFSLCAKAFGARIVWIDSIASIYHFSVSGRIMRRFADLFLTQWPELAERDSKAEYAGNLL